SGKELRCFSAHASGVCALAVSPDGSVILSADLNGAVRKWDLSRPLKYHEFDPDSLNLPVALDDNPDDPAALKKLGEWYAFRCRDDWAVECLQRARTAGEIGRA